MKKLFFIFSILLFSTIGCQKETIETSSTGLGSSTNTNSSSNAKNCKVSVFYSSPTEKYEITYLDNKAVKIKKTIGQEVSTVDLSYGKHNGFFYPIETMTLTTVKGTIQFNLGSSQTGLTFDDGTISRQIKARVINSKFTHTSVTTATEIVNFLYDNNGSYIGYEAYSRNASGEQQALIRSKTLILSSKPSAQRSIEFFGGLIFNIFDFEPWLEYEPTSTVIKEYDSKGNAKIIQEFKNEINETLSSGEASKVTFTSSDGKSLTDTRSFVCN